MSVAVRCVHGSSSLCNYVTVCMAAWHPGPGLGLVCLWSAPLPVCGALQQQVQLLWLSCHACRHGSSAVYRNSRFRPAGACILFEDAHEGRPGRVFLRAHAPQMLSPTLSTAHLSAHTHAWTRAGVLPTACRTKRHACFCLHVTSATPNPRDAVALHGLRASPPSVLRTQATTVTNNHCFHK